MADSERPKEEKPADEARHAHARAILTVDERIAHIVGMMASFQWERGVSAPKLAAQWGLSVSTVEKHSQEAHRRITADKDEAERDITVGARKLFREAVQSGDAKAAKLMGDLWADVSGARAPEKRELMAQVSAAATPEAAARLVRETFGGHALPKEDDASRDAEAGGDTAVPPGASGE